MLLVLAAGALGATSTAQADELTGPIGGDPPAIGIAGRPAQLIARVDLWRSSLGCSALSFRPGTLMSVTLTPPAGVTLDDPTTATQPVALPLQPPALADPAIAAASWRLTAPAPGVRTGSVAWEATNVLGKRCAGRHTARVVTTTAAPTLQSTGAVRTSHGVAVVLRAAVPGAGVAGRPDAARLFRGLFLGDATPSDLLRPRGGRVLAARSFDAAGTACVLVAPRPAATTMLRYWLRGGPHAGTPPVLAGRVRVSRHPTSAAQRRCARLVPPRADRMPPLPPPVP